VFLYNFNNLSILPGVFEYFIKFHRFTMCFCTFCVQYLIGSRHAWFKACLVQGMFGSRSSAAAVAAGGGGGGGGGVRRASCVVRRSSFVVRRSSFVVRRSSFVVRRSSSCWGARWVGGGGGGGWVGGWGGGE
jgi:hypothetical protein